MSFEEYTGKALEKRLDAKIFGGWKMFKKILEINRSQATLRVGESLPSDLKIIDSDAKLKE
jgi:chemotaxis receptor (MCP) glutamine deamidase CheD